MSIDFHDTKNAQTYAQRGVDESWVEAITALVAPHGKRVADIGCGGGIYSKAWAELGASRVVGVDFSAAMLGAARATCDGLVNVSFVQGDALAAGLPDASADIVFERALLHHLSDIPAAVREAARILAPGGIYLAQDRAPDDMRLPGSPQNIRNYFHERFPRLLEVELRRRPRGEDVRAAIAQAGFTNIGERTFWEVRRVYPDADALAADLAARVDRSILHELSDDELADLIAYVRARLPATGPIVDSSRWTLWSGTRPR
ncbi:MAG TPA: methyltransferase domain-containing protein [Ktedonobacterales bacterium]